MTSTWGKMLKLSIFGQSHGPAIGMVLDGLPAGFAPDLERLSQLMRRRAPGQAEWATARREEDQPVFLSGLVNGVTCGAPLAALIENKDMRSGDYPSARIPRPGHADFTAWARYGQDVDLRGGGHFSGRLTAPLVLAGGLARQILEQNGIHVGAHIAAIADVADSHYEPVELSREQLLAPGASGFPVLDARAGALMRERIAAALAEGDSLGGVIEGAAIGLPVGWGGPLFEGLENRLAAMMFAIPAVKGIEFGAGFAAARMRGSENNDAFILSGGRVRTRTNHHGGILGGISSGMPLIFRLAVKPTPSIAQEQQSVELDGLTETPLTVRGRHDPCIVPRAVPCVEAATALTLLDLMLEYGAEKGI